MFYCHLVLFRYLYSFAVAETGGLNGMKCSLKEEGKKQHFIVLQNCHHLIYIYI